MFRLQILTTKNALLIRNSDDGIAGIIKAKYVEDVRQALGIGIPITQD